MDRFMRKCAMDRKIVEQLILKKSFNKIERDLQVGKKRVKKVYEMAKALGYLDGNPLPPYPAGVFESSHESTSLSMSIPNQSLLEHKDWIKERLELGWKKVTIHEELPVRVSPSSFYRFLKRHKLCKVKSTFRVVPEIIHSPGESLILDWGKLCDVIDPETGDKRTLWFLAGIMGHSRYMMVRLVWDNKLATTLNALESMFNEAGGVPRKLTSDNPKCFSTEASKFEPILNPGFERFCSHYGVLAEMLPPAAPEKKGKVERLVPYVRRLYEAYGEFISIRESQSYLDKKVAVANERKHGTTKLRPLDVFLQDEAIVLKDLPEISFAMEEYHTGKVRVDGHVRFRGKYYSLREDYIGKEVFIIGSTDTVEIYFLGSLIETHPRLKLAHQSKATKRHHLKSHEQVLMDNNIYLDRAKKIGPYVYEMIEWILKRGNGFIDLRAIWGILNLDKDYSVERLDLACKHALECDQLGYRAVLRFINLEASEEKLIKKSSGNKFLRDPKEYLQRTTLN